MNIVITGGNTYVPIDKVRGITNIFKGKTACDIATEAINRGHRVRLIGNKEMESRVCFPPEPEITDINGQRTFSFYQYRTFDGLLAAMNEAITAPGFNWKPDVVIHSAAVSDYKVARVYGDDDSCDEVARDGKISSSHGRLIMELEPTAKIVDYIREPWGFKGVLVKFKLQVDMDDGELLRIAEKSRKDSGADIMVANCLEWARERAYILAGEAAIDVKRQDLASALLNTIERMKR